MAIGYLLYYGRLVDSRILPTTCALASEQSIATLGTVKRLNRLLGFVSSHRDGHRVFHASDMVLAVLSDASYLSRPRARSVTGLPPPGSCASLGSAVGCPHVHQRAPLMSLQRDSCGVFLGPRGRVRRPFRCRSPRRRGTSDLIQLGLSPAADSAAL